MKGMIRRIEGCAAEVLLAVLALTVAGCATPKAVAPSPQELNQYHKVYLGVPEEDPRSVYPRVLARLKQCDFRVVEVKADGPAIDSQASGFVITSQGHLLTSAHGIEGNQMATIWINGSRHPAKVLATDTNLDVALLQIEGDKSFPYLSFSADTNYHMGQDAFTMGFPLVEVLGTSPRLNKGLISSAVGLQDDPNQVQFSAEVQPGNSGGPLLNSSGQIIGLVISTLNPMNVLMRSGGNLPQNVNFAAKNGPVLAFLKQAGVEPPAAGNAGSGGFDAARDSLAIVRAGLVTDEDLASPSLICFVKYLSFWDMWYRFRVFHVEFRDTKTGKTVLKAGQYGDNVFSTEDRVLDRTFREIFAQFHPGRPNPFGEEKDKSGSPKQQ